MRNYLLFKVYNLMWITILILFAFPSVFAETVTIQLNCSSANIVWDTFVRGSPPPLTNYTNFGGAQDLREQDNDDNHVVARSYLMYNISMIPLGVTIDKAIFAKFSSLNDGNQNHDLQVHNVYDNTWDEQTEMTMTFNNQVCGTAIPFSDSDDCNMTYMDKLTSNSLQWDYFDVTPSIKYHLSQGNKNATFIVTTDETGLSRYTDSYTKENNCDAFPIHYLNITYLNSLNATLTITKIVINNDTGAQNVEDFTLKINDTVVITGAPNSLPPGTYKVSEDEFFGYNSTIGGDCDNEGNINLGQGDNKTCIITNDDVPVLENSSLTLIKIVVNNDTCKLTASNLTLKVNDTVVDEGVPFTLPPGYYNANEAEDLQYVASFLGDCDKNGDIDLGQKQNKTCIILNDDITPGTINGIKFRDINGNGIRDVNDTRLSGWRIYIDANNNGIKDKNEKFELTDKNGLYSFVGLGQGTYIIRESPKTGWTPTTPPDGKHIVVIDGSGIIVNNIDFGNRKP